MDSYDLKKALPALYAPRPGDFHVVEVPELLFLTIDGHGDPNISPAYAEAVGALFTLSYAVRAVTKSELGQVHTVGPLEGLWNAEDPAAFVAGDKSAWNWTMMVCQPSWTTPGIVETATGRAAKKFLPALDRVRYAPYREGTSVQILHVGSYDAEAPVLARLHDEYLPDHGLIPTGRHHEVYLSDARRTAPAKLRTVLGVRAQHGADRVPAVDQRRHRAGARRATDRARDRMERSSATCRLRRLKPLPPP